MIQCKNFERELKLNRVLLNTKITNIDTLMVYYMKNGY